MKFRRCVLAVPDSRMNRRDNKVKSVRRKRKRDQISLGDAEPGENITAEPAPSSVELDLVVPAPTTQPKSPPALFSSSDSVSTTSTARRLSARLAIISVADLSQSGRDFVNAAIEFAKSKEFDDSTFAVTFMEHWFRVLTIKDPRGLRFDPEIFQLSSSLLHQLGVNKYAELRYSTL